MAFDMDFNDETSLYDILDLKPDASPQEVREAYLRTKAAYGKDSVALYTLISADERERMLGRIEQAYDTLSSNERRKEYDRSHGLLDFDEADAPARVPHNQKIISIDRVPPMENSRDSESLLVAPKTDFTSGTQQSPFDSGPTGAALSAVSSAGGTGSAAKPSAPAALSIHDADDSFFHPAAPESPAAGPTPAAASSQIPSPASSTRPASNSAAARPAEAALAHEIAQEVEWRGHFLRKVREARRISIEEMSNITKVSKTYIMAIEEENFAKLPAPVFMRGFVTQIAKVLRVPHDPVAAAYMARYQQARPDKTAK